MANVRILAAIAALSAGSQAFAAAPMAEVIGQPITVVNDGITNTLYFEPDGTVRIITPSSNTVPASWVMQGQNLCITKGAASECWPYQPFQAQQPQMMNSSCNAQSTWTAQNTNNAQGQAKGERGR